MKSLVVLRDIRVRYVFLVPSSNLYTNAYIHLHMLQIYKKTLDNYNHREYTAHRIFQFLALIYIQIKIEVSNRRVS